MTYSALWYLQSRSVVNAVRARILRLRQPKYLAGAAMGVGYLWMAVLRPTWGVSPAHAAGFTPEVRGWLETGVSGLLAVGFVLMWVFASDRASLRFSEAEVAFLFPAPLSRRTLIHFRLIRLVLGTLFSALLFSLMSGRALRDGRALFHIAGWWMVLTTVGLHSLGASFTIQQWTERGLSGWRRRVCVVAVFAACLGWVAIWGRDGLAQGFPEEWNAVGPWLEHWVSAGPMRLLLAPVRWVVRPWFSESWGEFIRHAGLAGLVMAAHYAWVVRADVSFEEASIEASRKMAERMAAARGGRLSTARQPTRPASDPFPLAPTGFPPMALLWKNLLSAGQIFTIRFWLLMLWMVVVGGILTQAVLPKSDGNHPVQWIVAGFVSVVFLLTFFLGPQLFRNDFRSDLPHMDWLKSLPLPPWQIVLGEILAPWCLLVGLQWLLLVAMAGVSVGLEWPDGPALPQWRGPILIAAAMLVPPVDFLLLCLPNAAALLFPAWVSTGGLRQPGIEVMGQRMIFALGQMLVLVLALFPAALLGWGIRWAISGWTGPAMALWVTALVVTVAWTIEGVFVIRWLGMAFARFDASAES